MGRVGMGLFCKLLNTSAIHVGSCVDPTLKRLTCWAHHLRGGVWAEMPLGAELGGSSGVILADVASQGLAHVVDAHVHGKRR